MICDSSKDRKVKQNISIILESELFSTISYYDRLFTVCDHIEKMSAHPDAQKISANLYYDLHEFMNGEILLSSMQLTTTEQNLMVLNSPKIFFKCFDLASALSKILSTLLTLPTNKEALAKTTATFINITLSHCYELHSLIMQQGSAQIEYPRSYLLTGEKRTLDQKKLRPLFFCLDQARLDQLFSSDLDNVNSLQGQRDKKYTHHIKLGHEAIFHKDPKKALEHFQRATIYSNTAEALTMLGWVQAQLGNVEKAKDACLEAIKIDSDYGAAYNDLGSYLLAEKQFDQALKWFNMAKKATHYQNREYPYINSSKIHMTLKNYKEALSELEQAHNIAPYHEELQSMIQKIQHLLHVEKRPSSNFSPTIV